MYVTIWSSVLSISVKKELLRSLVFPTGLLDALLLLYVTSVLVVRYILLLVSASNVTRLCVHPLRSVVGSYLPSFVI